jgi:hypothetical protein
MKAEAAARRTTSTAARSGEPVIECARRRMTADMVFS